MPSAGLTPRCGPAGICDGAPGTREECGLRQLAGKKAVADAGTRSGGLTEERCAPAHAGARRDSPFRCGGRLRDSGTFLGTIELHAHRRDYLTAARVTATSLPGYTGQPLRLRP
jgi:hypothetical protein